MKEDILKILIAVEGSRYEEALAAIAELPEESQTAGRIVIAGADCHYEMGSDLEALQGYLKYLELYPAGRGKDFALMGIVCCLKNLDLQPEAKAFLDRMSDGHEGKEKEMDHSITALVRQAQAKAILADYSGPS